MSGRSAHVRKEKQKDKDDYSFKVENGTLPSVSNLSVHSMSIGDFPLPSGAPTLQSQHTFPLYPHQSDHITSVLQKQGYDIARKFTPVMDSQISKSKFRSLVDRNSENVRQGLTKTFGSKKKKQEYYPETHATCRAEATESEAGREAGIEADNHVSTITNSQPSKMRSTGVLGVDSARPRRPEGAPSPIPQGPSMKKWLGNGKAPELWRKLGTRDPELWDSNGDTLVYFGQPSQNLHPSFCISSYLIQQTRSTLLDRMLRDGAVERNNGFDMPLSPNGSLNAGQPTYQTRLHQCQQTTPPVSVSDRIPSDLEGQISYRLYFGTPLKYTPNEASRHKVAIRNVFALLYDGHLCGFNFYETLTDLEIRLEKWMEPGEDCAGMIVEYLVGKALDDFRDNPSMAASVLAWSELKGVRWEAGWTEAFIHLCGMHTRAPTCPDIRFLSTISRVLIDRASFEIHVRLNNAQIRLNDFNFADIWPKTNDSESQEKQAFDKGREFFIAYYRSTEGRWPPLKPAAEDHWLSRSWAQKLEEDFGSLYDNLVDRTVIWDGHEERNGRKWNIIKKGTGDDDVESSSLPLTDTIVAFDNQCKVPHITHPYCLVPEFIEIPSKKSEKESEDSLSLWKAGLAYTEATNIFALGADGKDNRLLQAFLQFEKDSCSPSIDAIAARRGRWLLIYMILQVLGSVSVDSPIVRYSDGVSYHLSPAMTGAPPWDKHRDLPEVAHNQSYCFVVPETWKKKLPMRVVENDPETQRPRIVSTIQYQPIGLTRENGSPVSASESEGEIIRGFAYKKQAAADQGLVHESPRKSKQRASGRMNAQADMRTNTEGYDAYSNHSILPIAEMHDKRNEFDLYSDRHIGKSSVANDNGFKVLSDCNMLGNDVANNNGHSSYNDGLEEEIKIAARSQSPRTSILAFNMDNYAFSPARSERLDVTKRNDATPVAFQPTARTPIPDRRNVTAPPVLAPTPIKPYKPSHETRLRARADERQREQERELTVSNTGYLAGVEKIDEMPILHHQAVHEESRQCGRQKDRQESHIPVCQDTHQDTRQDSLQDSGPDVRPGIQWPIALRQGIRQDVHPEVRQSFRYRGARRDEDLGNDVGNGRANLELPQQQALTVEEFDEYPGGLVEEHAQ